MLRWPYAKDPQSSKKYTVEWQEFLDDGEIIAESSWTVPEGITSTGNGHTSDATFIQLAGGEAGNVYLINNHITTSFGNTVNRDIILAVEER